MNPTEEYISKCQQILQKIDGQKELIDEVATLFAASIAKGRLVHCFGSGHSRIMVEEMWPRYGSFPGFHPIVELSLTFHNQVVGANGQRQAMFLENVSGLAARILRNFNLSEEDSALVISSSGCNIVPVEIAQIFQDHGIKVVSIISKDHATASKSNHPNGQKLSDFSDIVLDTGAPVGDAMIDIPGLKTPVSPGSTIGGIALINSIKAGVAQRLTAMGQPPKVLTAGAILGAEEARILFEEAYDEHGRRIAQLYHQPGGAKNGKRP